MIVDIMQVVAVNKLSGNNIHDDGSIFLALVFKTEIELSMICQELHIKVR